MKKLLTAVTVAGLLVGGAATTAWAADPGGTSGGSGGGAAGAQQGRRGHGVRLAIQTAASTIGVQPQDLLTQTRGGKTVAQVATEHGVDPASVVNAIVAAGTQRIDQAAAQGTIDASKADQAKQKLPDFANRFVNEARPKSGNGRGYGLRKDAVQAAAKEIGVSTDDLKQARKDGKTIAQVAKDHDKSVDDVVSAIVKAATSDIDQAVKNGKLDSKRADELKSKLPDRVKQLVNGERKQGPQTTETTGATQ
jgi:ribosomal protein S20